MLNRTFSYHAQAVWRNYMSPARLFPVSSLDSCTNAHNYFMKWLSFLTIVDYKTADYQCSNPQWKIARWLSVSTNWRAL